MGNAKSGALWLTCAQVWHAVSGYLIFITGARLLGIEAFDDFGLVIWTMTTLEILVVDGVPRAVSWWTAKVGEASSRIALLGFILTVSLAALLGVALILLAGPLDAYWGSPGLVKAIRISALDFVAFAGFAVLTQSVNGLRRYRLQAGIWGFYSTAKVVAAVSFMKLGWGIEGAVMGYVVGSFAGSLAAFAFATPLVSKFKSRDAPDAPRLLKFGTPVAFQAFALMSLINIDLWMAKRSGASERSIGAYAAAATLARALFFVFKAFGDALFPAVTEALATGRPKEARRVARKGLGQLACFLLPATGLATGAALPVMEVIYANSDPTGAAYEGGSVLLRYLAPASTAWTFTAVCAVLISAAARPTRVAIGLLLLLAIQIPVLQWCSTHYGLIGVAQGLLAMGILGFLLSLYLLNRALGSVFPPIPFAAALLGGLILDRTLNLWAPHDFWVFAYGAGLYALLMALFVAAKLPGFERK